ncbi:MAG: MOSC domain-containing protein [Jatrophihabitans sp.]
MAAAIPTGEVVSVNLAQVRPTPAPNVHTRTDQKPQLTGIDKRPASGPVAVGRLGLGGDTICDTANHGGPDQAGYAYAEEDAQWWQAHLGAELRFPLGPGAFGENLTLRGIDITGAVIGERWQIGSVVLQVSVPRIPCSTFAGFWQVDRLVKRFTEAGRPGSYLRVLVEGELSAGDPVQVLERPAHGLTVAETFRALTGDRSLAPKLLTAPELPAALRAKAGSWLAASAR